MSPSDPSAPLGQLGEFGWGDADDAQPFGRVGSAVLVVAAGLYGASVWLAGGLAPLAYLSSRVSTSREGTHHQL
jgi:hypothetical protein